MFYYLGWPIISGFASYKLALKTKPQMRHCEKMVSMNKHIKSLIVEGIIFSEALLLKPFFPDL